MKNVLRTGTPVELSSREQDMDLIDLKTELLHEIEYCFMAHKDSSDLRPGTAVVVVSDLQKLVEYLAKSGL